MVAFRSFAFTPLFSSAQTAILLVVDVHRAWCGTAEKKEVAVAAGAGVAATGAAEVDAECSVHVQYDYTYVCTIIMCVYNK